MTSEYIKTDADGWWKGCGIIEKNQCNWRSKKVTLMFNQILYPKDRNIYHVKNEKEEKCQVEWRRKNILLRGTWAISC